MLGSSEVRVIPGFEFREYPCLQQKQPSGEEALAVVVKSQQQIGKVENGQTLYEYYGGREAVYTRN